MNHHALNSWHQRVKQRILEHLRTDWEENGFRGTIGGIALLVSFPILFGLGFVIESQEEKSVRGSTKTESRTADSAKPMPLTIASIIEIRRQLDKPSREVLQSMLQENDLTKPIIAVKPIKTDPRFESASFDRELIRQMGYDYSLTVREVARNRKTLESRVQALILSDIGKHAAEYRNELLREKLIDPETFRILNASYPADER